MRSIPNKFGTDLPNAVRVDHFDTVAPAASAYHLARFAGFGDYIPPSTPIVMERCFSARANTHTSIIAVAPERELRWANSPARTSDLGVRLQSSRGWLGHRSITSTAVHTALASNRHRAAPEDRPDRRLVVEAKDRITTRCGGGPRLRPDDVQVPRIRTGWRAHCRPTERAGSFFPTISSRGEVAPDRLSDDPPDPPRSMQSGRVRCSKGLRREPRNTGGVWGGGVGKEGYDHLLGAR
jgi:hypothetical protein